MTRSILTAAFLVTTLLASAATPTLTYKTDVVVDGQYDEWGVPLPMSNKRTGLNFDMANDERHLYFFLRVTDKNIQRQIVSNGFELWINADGKKKKTTGLFYPMPQEEVPAEAQETSGARSTGTDRGNRANQGGRPERNPWDPFAATDESSDRFVISRDMQLQGFLIENGKQPAKGHADIRTAITLDADGSMLYELAIPFNTFLKERLDSEDAGRTFAICFLVKKAGANSQTAQMMRMGRSMGYMGPPPVAMMGAAAEERTYWLKVKPAIP